MNQRKVRKTARQQNKPVGQHRSRSCHKSASGKLNKYDVAEIEAKKRQTRKLIDAGFGSTAISDEYWDATERL